MEFLTNEELLKLSPGQLFRLFSQARIAESFQYNHGGDRCCNICNEFIGTEKEWQEVIKLAKKYGEYKKQIHLIMKTKPYYARSKKKRQEVAGKKPRRNKPNRK